MQSFLLYSCSVYNNYLCSLILRKLRQHVSVVPDDLSSGNSDDHAGGGPIGRQTLRILINAHCSVQIHHVVRPGKFRGGRKLHATTDTGRVHSREFQFQVLRDEEAGDVFRHDVEVVCEPTDGVFELVAGDWPRGDECGLLGRIIVERLVGEGRRMVEEDLRMTHYTWTHA